MTYSELILSHSPSNYWKLNESAGLTAVDSAGSAPGTISGGVTLAQAGALADGTTAMLFNGTTGKIVTPATAVLTPCTLEAWVKTTGFGPMVGTAYSGTQEEWHLRLEATGLPRLIFFTAGQAQQTSVLGVTDCHNGAWHHLVAICQSGTSTLYVDGVVNVTGATGFAVTGMTLPVELGVDSGGPSFFNGSLDEVAIYPRALTATEISDHYAARLTTSVPSAGCDHTTVWSKHLATLSAPTVESERAYLATLYGEPGGTDFSTLVSRWLQEINCAGTNLEAALTPEPVQTAQASAASADTLTLTFPGATGNGRGLVVGVISSSTSALPAGACSDNKGNTYTRILSQTGTANSLAVYLCPKGVGGPVHTITIAPAMGAIDLIASALEVRGVGNGLALDASGSTSGSSTTPAATSSAVTTQGLVSMALMAMNSAQTSILVSTTDGQPPGWSELAEELT